MPRPTSELSETVPPACETIPYTVASPRPVPLPGGFVVKKGSKALATVSSLIPAPVSSTISRTPFSNSVAWIVSRPPSGIASRAFTVRFMRSCVTWLGSITVGGSSLATQQRRSMCSPIVRLSIGSMSRTTSARSSATASTGRRRLKASSWRTSSAPRVAAFESSSRSRRCASSVAASIAKSA